MKTYMRVNEMTKAQRERLLRAARAVADMPDTGDGMVEVKWDEMVHLRDAIAGIDAVVERRPLEASFLTGTAAEVLAVDVPGFGSLLVHPDRDEALLARGPGTGDPISRPATRIDGRTEIPMLHKAHRLDVIVEW